MCEEHKSSKGQRQGLAHPDQPVNNEVNDLCRLVAGWPDDVKLSYDQVINAIDLGGEIMPIRPLRDGKPVANWVPAGAAPVMENALGAEYVKGLQYEVRADFIHQAKAALAGVFSKDDAENLSADEVQRLADEYIAKQQRKAEVAA